MIFPGVNCIHPILLKVKDKNTGLEYGLTVGCGHCISCTKKRRREWTLRLIMESKYYSDDSIWHATLTYDEEHLPRYIHSTRPPFALQQTLQPKDVQGFLKRLRSKLRYPIRMFYVGEYGERTRRSHYHIILFGLLPQDVHFVEECWQNGFVMVKNFYNETCGYVAGYVQKKLFGKDVYDSQMPPFMRCSQNPSIGERYFWDNVDTICKQGFIVYDGMKYSIPRTFLRKAIAAGYLPEPDLDELQLLQNDGICTFLEKMDAQGVELSDYEKNFIILRENEFKRMNVSRNINEVV